jgi:CMP/dCMP kinase
MNKLDIITIDGPAGSGKSTVARTVADKLDRLYIDSGAMYRALTLKCLNEKIEFNKENILKEAKNIDIKLENKKVYLNGVDVSLEIRTPEVSSEIYLVAEIAEVRDIMVELQRKTAENNKCVMEGRDIGSVVFPDAKYKFYLDASVEERAKRRAGEYKQKNIIFDEDKLKSDIIERDNKDKNRDVGALKIVSDSIVIDTTSMSIDDVVSKILEKII